jgi:DAK2 domain fusion protein YloV
VALAPADLRAVLATYGELLASHRDVINRLNVYPVPDGDTGTNMALTVASVVEELDGADADMAATCKAISHGSLMGARGNSGVILSQILRGLGQAFAEVDEIGAADLQRGLVAAAEAAYGAVMKPTEGTILTVAREAAEGAAACNGGTLTAVLEASQRAGRASLERTPELLAVLAEAGVVDAGGAGLVLLFDAALHVVDGRPLPDPPADAPTAAEPAASNGHRAEDGLRYEVMYLLEAGDDSIPAFKDVWAGIGDSIVVVGGEGLWNCHIHTNDIGGAIEAALDVGRPSRIRVTDLTDEVEEEQWVREAARQQGDRLLAPADPVPTAVVAVSPAAGISRIFHSLGVQELVGGGPTMNPSTADLLAAVERAPAPEVVVLPNDSNIIPVAEQLDGESTKTVRVVRTTSFTEGFASLLAYDPQATAAENAASMSELADGVTTGEVTRAVRASSSRAGPIAAGDWLGLAGDGVRVVRPTMAEAATALLDELVTPGHELVTVIEGDGATAAATRRITAWLAAERPSVAVEVHEGGQPHYPYLFGVE